MIEPTQIAELVITLLPYTIALDVAIGLAAYIWWRVR